MTKKTTLKEKRNAIGRPSKYKPEYCEMLIAHMKAGYPAQIFGSTIGVCYKTVWTWFHKYPDFLQAKMIGEGLLVKHWMDLGTDLAKGKYQFGKTTAWVFTMKNILGWVDNTPTVNANVLMQQNGPQTDTIDVGNQDDGVPTFEVEVNENGKFKRLAPRRVG